MCYIIGRRKRCRMCEGCLSRDCEKCHYCFDKPKYGGAGVLKQCCIKRRCERLRVDCDTGIWLLHDWLYIVLYFNTENSQHVAPLYIRRCNSQIVMVLYYIAIDCALVPIPFFFLLRTEYTQHVAIVISTVHKKSNVDCDGTYSSRLYCLFCFDGGTCTFYFIQMTPSKWQQSSLLCIWSQRCIIQI